MGSRAGIVVTGTEVLTGRVSDRNGPWLADQLRILGVDVAHNVIVGDRPEDLRRALEFLASGGVDLIITSGGLGPTADDLTAAEVGSFQGRESAVDSALEEQIAAIVAGFSAGRGWRLDPVATAAATSKQALVPEGANVLAPVGTAPGLVVPPASGRTGPPVVVLPGPPRELQGMWTAVLDDPLVQAAISASEELRQHTIRLWGTPESELAATLRANKARLTDLEITTCLHDGELEIVTRYGAAAQPAYDELIELVGAAHGSAMFSPLGATVDEIVAEGLRKHGLTIATAESCTAGLLSARLTALPGSSTYVLGGLVVYSNEAKQRLLAVPAELIAETGAVSADVARAMAAGARAALDADIGIGITGVAGPGGGTTDKPVGLVHLCVDRNGRSVGTAVHLPGSRHDVRMRAVVVAMHMAREVIA